MKITIYGGGNIGTQFAVHCAEKKHDVIVYTSRPEIYDNQLSIVDDNGKATHEGIISAATNDAETAFRDRDLIFVCVPATLMEKAAKEIYPHSGPDTIIGVVPGSGGSECAFHKCIDRGNTFFGIERVPAVARLIQKGKSVRSIGYRNELHVASLPGNKAEDCARLVEDIFEIPCKVIPNYLNLTLTPSNPILHTTRLRTIFSDWEEGKWYDEVPLFYEEWDDASSELLLKCDGEVQEICHAFPELDLSFVKSLKDHYESPTVEAMTKKISSITAFKGLTTPTVTIEGKRIPDLHSRYFTADFSYGLIIIRQIADFAGIPTPNIDETMRWYDRIAVEKKHFSFADYGIHNRKEFVEFYSR